MFVQCQGSGREGATQLVAPDEDNRSVLAPSGSFAAAISNWGGAERTDARVMVPCALGTGANREANLPGGELCWRVQQLGSRHKLQPPCASKIDECVSYLRNDRRAAGVRNITHK